jgi:hypothetical protein
MGVLGGVRSTAEGLVCDNIGLGRSEAMRDMLVEEDLAIEQSQCRSRSKADKSAKTTSEARLLAL